MASDLRPLPDLIDQDEEEDGEGDGLEVEAYCALYEDGLKLADRVMNEQIKPVEFIAKVVQGLEAILYPSDTLSVNLASLEAAAAYDGSHDPVRPGDYLLRGVVARVLGLTPESGVQIISEKDYETLVRLCPELAVAKLCQHIETIVGSIWTAYELVEKNSPVDAERIAHTTLRGYGVRLMNQNAQPRSLESGLKPDWQIEPRGYELCWELADGVVMRLFVCRGTQHEELIARERGSKPEYMLGDDGVEFLDLRMPGEGGAYLTVEITPFMGKAGGREQRREGFATNLHPGDTRLGRVLDDFGLEIGDGSLTISDRRELARIVQTKLEGFKRAQWDEFITVVSDGLGVALVQT
jgi:hypothetical protein